MKIDTLKALLSIDKREQLYIEILEFLKELDGLDMFHYEEHDVLEGMIPIIKISPDINDKNAKRVKIFIGAQHNEYNGLFGIIEFLKMVKENSINVSDILRDNQILIFAPLMNPHGFLNPSSKNKSGYYLKNGSNLNRFWRRVFAPEHDGLVNDELEHPIPKHAEVFKSLIQDYWDNSEIPIYIIDFHETSLLERFPRELSLELNPYYKFDHWLKESVVKNIIQLFEIRQFREPLFYKCAPSADHTHINMTHKQVDKVFEKLHVYQKNNQGKLAFYYCHSIKSKAYCQRLAIDVYDKLKSILWDTSFPAVDHLYHDHGCFVKMSDATPRKNVFPIELESQKQFFDLFEEIDKSKRDPNYFKRKIENINNSLKLVIETITTMIRLN